MTKDLALCVYNTNDVPKDKYVNTLDFIKSVANNLKINLTSAKL
jgi:hypothetical protein